jgi:alpha-D-ribose 1-methylphosphonate 5-triphosphate synthase subunit PhnH
VPPEQADHVFAASPPSLAGLRCGSALYPDQGATLVLQAGLGRGQPLRLTGPGIEDEAVIHVAGPAPAFWAERAGACRYPAGIDLFLIDGARVMGLPRSTQIKVL